MQGYQIVDTIYLIQWEIWVDPVCPWHTGNKPAAANPSLEFVTVERVGPIHNKLKVVKFSPLPISGCSGRFFRVHFIKASVYTLLFRALKEKLPASFSVGRLFLLFGDSFLPFAKGKCGKTDINIAIFHGGYLLLILLMNTGKILRLICRNPLSLVLRQAASGNEL